MTIYFQTFIDYVLTFIDYVFMVIYAIDRIYFELLSHL